MPKKQPAKKEKTKFLKRAEKRMMKVDRSHVHFMGVLIVFAGFSLYAIASFFSSTNDYINNQYVSVLEAEGVSDIAPGCYTCPEPAGDFPECDLLWDTNVCPADNGFVAGIFEDVPVTHANYDAIVKLHDIGVIKGYADGTFDPDATINRAEFLTMVTNAVDADFGGMNLANCFSDVQEQWFSVYACYAKDLGWVKGYSGNVFSPGKNISKAEAIKIVFEAFDYGVCDEVNTKPYSDVQIGDWYAPYACKAKKDGIVVAAGLFNADHEMTRGEVVQVIYNVMAY